MKGKRFILYVLAALALVFVIQAIQAPKAAAWWDENYVYRRPITITTGENATQDGYPENILLTYDSDQAFDNFQDSRFAWENEDGAFELPYWFENFNSGDNAMVWVKLPVALNANTSADNLRWYYGNPSAEPNENGADVFRLFDNFDGDNLDGSKWNASLSSASTITVSGGQLTLASSDNPSWSWVFSQNTVPDPCWVGMKVDQVGFPRVGESKNPMTASNPNGTYYYDGATSSSHRIIRVTDAGVTASLATGGGVGGMGTWRFRWGDDVIGIDGSAELSDTGSEVAIGDYYAGIGQSDGGLAVTSKFDWVYVADSVTPDPVASVGGEEVARPVITAITASADTIDRAKDDENSGAVDSLTINVAVQHLLGRDAIENVFLWIRDNTDVVVVDNVQLTTYENTSDNMRTYSYTFDPDNSAQTGTFDVQAQAVDNAGYENTKDYNSLGHMLFFVDDLSATISIDDNTPIYQTGVSGAISRASGSTVSADNVGVVDNNEGLLAADNYIDSEYYDNYGLTTPTRLYRGDIGSVYVWARDDNLDGVSSSVTYEVEGDNAAVTLGTINNQTGQSVVNFTAAWDSDSASVSSGTAYHQDNTSYEATISSGSGSFTLSHSTWKTSGATAITIYDNADRPLWNVSNATFNTDALTWYENVALSGTEDNASLTVRIAYSSDNTSGATIKSELLAGAVDNGEVTADADGLLQWLGIDLPDNTQNIQITLDNVYDSRTDKAINANSVEDAAVYTENTTCIFTFTDNDNTLYYGTGNATLEGTVTSQASYVSLTVQENLHFYLDNNDLISSTSTTLAAGGSANWIFTDTPWMTAYYTVIMQSADNTIMWQENARATVRLSTPTFSSPDNENGMSDNAPTLQWGDVSGALSYAVQVSTYENFDNADETTFENTASVNNAAVGELVENRYYWRVQAATTLENVENSDWTGVRNFWVDSTIPSVDSFTINSGASSTASSTVTLTISASDSGSGAYQMCFQNESAGWSSWEAYSTSKSWSLSSGDGTKTVYVKVRDTALNESATASDTITKTTESSGGGGGGGGGSGGGGSPPPSDTTAPTLTVLAPTTTNVSENVTVQVKATDSSGIDSGSISVTLDGGATTYTWADGVITSPFTKLSAGGHLVVVTAKDASSNHNQASVNISFTVVLPAVENAIENIENAMPEATGVITVAITTSGGGGEIGARENGTATFDNENLSVSKVTISISENLAENEVVENVAASAQVLENAPAEAMALPENVSTYAYLEISTTAPKDTVASVSISFKVSKNWLEASGISPLAVALYHLENGAWVELPTTKISEDNTDVYYSAATSSLSSFMIGAKTVFPTFSLQLPATPMRPENGFIQITLWVANPTPEPIAKRCELRLGSYVRPFDVEVQAGQDLVAAVYVDVIGVDSGTYDVKLYDADTDTILDKNQITLLSAAEQPEISTVSAAPQSPLLIAVVGAVLSVAIVLGALYVSGRQLRIRMPRVRLLPKLRRSKGEVKEKSVGEKSPVLRGYKEAPATREFSEEASFVIEGYSDLLSPAAREFIAKKKMRRQTGKTV